MTNGDVVFTRWSARNSPAFFAQKPNAAAA
jgi:hypothetical protein